MADDEERLELFNPLASFYVEGEEEDENALLTIIDLYGVDGARVRLQYPSSGSLYLLREMVQRAEVQMAFGEEHGILALAEEVGREGDDTLTSEDIEGFLDE